MRVIFQMSFLLYGVMIAGLFIFSSSAYAEQSDSTASISITNNFIEINSTTEGTVQSLHIPRESLLFDIIGHTDQSGNLESLSMQRKPDLYNVYKDLEVAKNTHDAVFIYPSFTQAAYEKGGFYDFYRKDCDSSCLTVPIPTRVNGFQSSSIFGAWALKLLNYSHVKDEDIDKNPSILKQYKRVIVLHNEYVTKKEFDAITSHPDVIFLYPNALYAEVKTNYTDNTITLVHGHGYPNSTIKNGFDWKYDNSKYEYDVDCNNWHFYKSGNYSMLNCYPEFAILHTRQMMRMLQDKNPTYLSDDLNAWSKSPDNQDTIVKLLSDYGIKGTHVPHWVRICSTLYISGEISQDDFSNMLEHLRQKNLLA
ncbi:MAG: hypothetical protein LV477_11820 [Candidatus Nitrosotalea sp.]|nr:hypothetical protein [Candidatus Nitrosotalea sp.]